MPPKWVDIKVDGQNMETYLAQPMAAGTYPAIVVAQEIWGVNAHIQEVTNRLPAQGYVGLAPALFHREGPMTLGLHEEWDDALARLGRLRDNNLLADVRAAVEFLKAQPNVRGDRIGIIGFCAGGRTAYLAAANISDIKATVAFYPGGILVPRGEGHSPVEQTANINSPVLGIFGEEDENPSPADVEKVEAELKKHSKSYDFHKYSGAGHGFHRDRAPSYRREAAEDAWGKAMAWFERHLKG